MNNAKFKNLIDFSAKAIVSATTFTLITALFKHGLIVDWTSTANHFFDNVNIHPELGNKFFNHKDFVSGATFGLAYGSYDQIKNWFKKSKDLDVAKEYLILYQKSNENPQSEELNKKLVDFIEKEKSKLEKMGLETKITPKFLFDKVSHAKANM